MKLYHIDRKGVIEENTVIKLKSNITIDKEYINNKLQDYLEENFKEGLSYFGRTRLLNELDRNNAIDVIFEYERSINYPDKLSRLSTFFAFDKEGIKKFYETMQLEFEFNKIYEVESDYYEKHDLNLIKGWSAMDTIANAKYYWENKMPPETKEDYIAIEEYLLKFPVKVGKEVNYKDIIGGK